MYRPLVLVLALALALALASLSCASTRTPAPAFSAPLDDVLCSISSPWTVGDLLSSQSGEAWGSAWQADAEALLLVRSGVPELRVHVALHGWHLVGLTRPELRTRGARWLAPGIGVAPGAHLPILDARQGEVQVTVPNFSLQEESGFRFVQRPRPWLPCEELGFEFQYRDDETPRRDRESLGLPARLETRTLPSSGSASFSIEPGGQPFLHLGPRGWPQELGLLEEGEEAAQVVYQDWTGTLVVGWVDRSVFGDEEDSGGGGLLGRLGGSDSAEWPTCTAMETTPLWVVPDGGEREAAGWLDPGATYRLVEQRRDGTIRLVPVDGSGAYIQEGWSLLASIASGRNCVEPEPP
jgi:hypothetical protein